MILELSFNNDNLEFSVNLAVTRTNYTKMIMNVKKERGKIRLALETSFLDSDYIYLNISQNIIHILIYIIIIFLNILMLKVKKNFWTFIF